MSCNFSFSLLTEWGQRPPVTLLWAVIPHGATVARCFLQPFMTVAIWYYWTNVRWPLNGSRWLFLLFFCSHPAAAAVCRFLAACVRGKSIYGYRLMCRAAAELPPRPPPPTNPGLGAMRWSRWSVLVLLCKAAACIPQDHFLTQVGEQSAQEILEFQFKEGSGRDSVGTHRADVWANYVMWLLQYIDSV